jgi:outer membrane protein TolC
LAVARKNAGRGTELAVQRFQAEVRKNQSEKLVVRQEIVEVENRVNVLVGRFPQPVERTAGNFLDLTVPAVSVGLPAQLLANRPDIRRAERELAAAGLDVLVARARFFPRLDITAGVGWEAFNPRYLFDPGAFIAGAAGGFVAPFINRRAIQADYLTANARQLQALYNYQQVVLDAFREVATQVSAAENYRTSIEIKRQQLQALVASVDAASQLFQNARAEYIEVLFAQRDLQDARTETVERKRRQLSAIVNAYQALGGGSNTITNFDPVSQQGQR